MNWSTCSQVNVLESCLRSDALNVPSEEEVVMSLLRWIRHDLLTRQKLLPGLLSLTRLHHLPALKVETHSMCQILRVTAIYFDVLWRSHPFFVSSPLSESQWCRHFALQQWVLPRPDLGGSEPTGSVQWHAHWCQAGHHSELYLHPQDRGEWWDPPYLLLLSGNGPVERTGNRTWRGSSHDTRLTGILSHQLCREGTFWCYTLKFSLWAEGITWRVKEFTCRVKITKKNGAWNLFALL